MGKTQSHSAQNTGNAQVNVINQLEAHSEAHEGHELKLWLILSLVVIQTAILLYKQYTKSMNRCALKAARSVIAVNHV